MNWTNDDRDAYLPYSRVFISIFLICPRPCPRSSMNFQLVFLVFSLGDCHIGLLVHFGAHWNTPTAFGCIAMKLCIDIRSHQRINPTGFCDFEIYHLTPKATTVWWIAVKVSIDIQALLKMITIALSDAWRDPVEFLTKSSIMAQCFTTGSNFLCTLHKYANSSMCVMRFILCWSCRSASYYIIYMYI